MIVEKENFVLLFHTFWHIVSELSEWKSSTEKQKKFRFRRFHTIYLFYLLIIFMLDYKILYESKAGEKTWLVSNVFLNF